jgi:hypothetical protein
MRLTSTPQMSDREAMLAADRRWRDSDGKEHFGAVLAKRLWSLGWIDGVQQLLDIPVGGCLKAGVSAYERIA